MKTVTEHLRARLLVGADSKRIPPLDTLRQSEWSTRFEHLMRNRLIMGVFRYGRLNAPGKPDFDRVGRAMAELEYYLRDHNKERLVDVANMMLLEFEEGSGVWQPSDDEGLHARVVRRVQSGEVKP